MPLILIGIICGYIAITMDTSVESGGTYEYGVYIPKMKVNNIGLMNQQTNLLIGAGIAFISGILLIGFNSKSGGSSSGGIRTCPYCAEQVKVEATICRFCQKDLPVLNIDLENNAAVDLQNQPTEAPAWVKVYVIIFFWLLGIFLLMLYIVNNQASRSIGSVLFIWLNQRY